MKKLSISIATLLFLLVLNINTVNALPGGLLNGKPMTHSARDGSSAIQTNNATDSNTATGVGLSYSNGVRPILSYTVPNKTMSVTGFEMRSTGGYFTLTFYDSSNNVLREFNTPSNGNGAVDVSIENVAKVEIRNRNSNGMTVYEFDVFGSIEVSIPQNLTAVPDTRSGHLKWDALGDEDLAGYNVYLDTSKVNEELITTNEYTVSGLTPDQLYKVFVTAVYDGGDESISSNVVDLEPYDDPISDIALNVASYVNYLAFTWNEDEKASTYSVFDADTGQIIVGGLSSPVYNLTGLEPNVTKNVYVVGYDKYGRSVTSNTVTATTREPPEVIKPVIYLESKSFDNIKLRWNASGRMYQLFVNGVPSGITTTNFYTFTNLEPETAYTYSIVAIDEYDRYTQSNILTVTTDSLPEPYDLRLSVSSITSTSARLTYTPSFVSYKVLLNGEEVRQSASTFHQLYDLSPNTSYQVQVIGVDKYGRSVESNQLTFSTLEEVVRPPTPPPEPPPQVSESNNPDLNNVNDHLVQGAVDSKDNAMLLIPIILGILLLVFGSWWLVRVFKKKMVKSTGKGSGRGNSNMLKRPIPVGKPMNAPTMNRYGKGSNLSYNKTNSNSNFRRNNYHVEKQSYRGRYKGKR